MPKHSEERAVSNDRKPRRARRKGRREPEVTVRWMTDGEFDALQRKKQNETDARQRQRRKALEVLNTNQKSERAAARSNSLTPAEREAARIEAGETAGQKPSDYRRKIRRK